MKKRNGFTMVELLAVLIILGIIMLIAVPAISKLLSSTDKDYYTALEGTVRSYGQEYFSDRRTLLPRQSGNIKLISIDTLVNQKYGDEPVDPKGNSCTGNVTVQRKATGKYEYTTCLECPEYTSDDTVCRYDESTNDKLVITGVENKIIKQGASFSLPKAQAVINGEKIADVNPSPSWIDTNQLTTYDVYYTYQTAAKIVKYTVTDQTAPSKPNVVLTLANGTAYNQGWTNQAIFQNISATDWTKTDVMGSGIKAFKISGDGKRTWDTINARDGKISLTQTDPVNKTYYVKAIDYAGNESAIVSYTLKLDRTAPSFSSLKIQSTNRNYNVTTTKLTLSASDSQSLKMCISNTGYEKGCSWENFSTQKNWTVPGGLDGITRTVYVTVKDEAGNKVNKAVNYTTYKECSLVNATRPAYGACTKSCGGGLQYRTVTEKDKNTSKVCRTYQESQPCNTHSCIEYRYRNIVSPTWTTVSRKPDRETRTGCNYGYPYDYMAKKCKVMCMTLPTGKCTNWLEVMGNKVCLTYASEEKCTYNNPVKANCPVCNRGELKYLSDNYKDALVFGYNMRQIKTDDGASGLGSRQFWICPSPGNFDGGYYTCLDSENTCPSGYTMSGGKCYGPWSAWSGTPVTATSTREVQTRNQG